MSVRDPNPLNRPFTWSFSTSQTTVDVNKEYFEDPSSPGQFLQRLMYNTAFDVIEGNKKRRSELTLRVSGNIAGSPFAVASSVIDCTNATGWAGGLAEHWLCTGYSATQESELVGTEVLTYWRFNASFTHRRDGWLLSSQNVGFNELVYANGVNEEPTGKRRIAVEGAYVARPWPLDSIGVALPPVLVQSGTTGELNFRVYEPVDFAEIFGNPPA